MKTFHQKSVVAAVVAFYGFSFCPVLAQTVPPPPVTEKPAEAPVKLDPFSVTAESDVGFVGASSLAGGRIATPLKDTPVAYSVLTKEFLDAFNLTDVAQASAFTVGANTTDNDGTQRMYARTEASQITLRGVKVGQPQVNFFTFQYTGDSYNADRIDFARGPNSVLFGAGGVGGTVNTVTKQARLNQTIQELRLQFGSYDRYRTTLDINQPITAKLAARLNLMASRGDTWRAHEYTKRTGYHLTSTYNITPALTVRGEVEYGDRSELKFTLLRDFLSAWDGKTYDFVAPLTGAGAPTNAFLASAGIQRRTPMKWVFHPSFGPNPINFQNTFETVGAAQNSDPTLTNTIRGVPIKTVGFSLRGAEMAGSYTGVSQEDRFAQVMAGSPYFQIPSQSDTTLWTSEVPTYHEKSLSRSLYLNYNLGENLFIELAGNVNESVLFGRSNVRDGLNDVRMDIVRTLPNGAPNPNFLRPYTEFFDQRVFKNHTFTNLRAQAVYRKETRFGKLQAGVMAGQTKHLLEERSDQIILPLTSVRADARGWASDVEQTQFTYWTRFYLDEKNRPFDPDRIVRTPITLTNPVTGVTETVTPRYIPDIRREERLGDSKRRLQFIQAAGNFDLFNNRLVLIAAVRRDVTQYQQLRFLQAGKMPAGWDGSYLTYRPLPPADYFELTYLPKDATGKVIGPPDGAFVRPTSIVNGVPLPLPQYANDRFRDDYSVPIVYNNVNTFTTGAVVNVKPWLGLYGNVAETYDLSEGTTPLIDGSLGKTTTSKGTDYGVRFTLPNGRMSLNIGLYDASQVGARVTAPGGFTNAYNSIAASPVIGDLSENGRNIRGVRNFTFAVQSTVTSHTKGFEVDLTANFTPSWRLTLNAAKTKPVITDRYPEMIEYYNATESIIRQILTDSGVIIGADNVATIDPAVNDPAKINQTRVQAAATAWNNLQQTVLPNVLGTAPQVQTGQSPWVGNVATDYRFRSGRLKGLRIGAAVNYRGAQVVDFRGNDTIVSPTNPAVAIDDPSVDQYTPVYGNSYYKVTGTLSYTMNLKKEGRRLKPKTIQFDLIVDNLLNYTDPIYGNLGTSAASAPGKSVPLNGDWTTPARVTVPGNPGVIMPRNYLLTATIAF